MGEVIGPLNWSTKDRKATWVVMRDLREIAKYRRQLSDLRRASGDPEELRKNEGNLDALEKETIYYKDQFNRWMSDSKQKQEAA